MEMVLTCFKVQFHHLPGDAEKNNGRVKKDLLPSIATVSHDLRLLNLTITRNTVPACSFVYCK